MIEWVPDFTEPSTELLYWGKVIVGGVSAWEFGEVTSWFGDCEAGHERGELGPKCYDISEAKKWVEDQLAAQLAAAFALNNKAGLGREAG